MRPPQNFLNGRYLASALSLAKFELKGIVGRLVARRATPIGARKLLQLGCGENPRPEFVNLDFYRRHNRDQLDVMHDLRRPLPFPSGVFEGIFTEHVLEHLAPQAALRLLEECHRVLAEGGKVRIVVPDLEKYIAYYVGTPPSAQFESFANGCEAIWSLTQNWGHVSVWDSTMLGWALGRAGFDGIRKVEYGVGDDRRLLVDNEERAWESLYMEATKLRGGSTTAGSQSR